MYRFEIRYENADSSGSVFVLAETAERASEQFATDWSEFGDPVPSHWVVGQWSIE